MMNHPYSYSNPVSTVRNLTLSGMLWLGVTAAPVLGADSAASSPALTSFQRPPWLTDLSVGVKESWDSNVYLSGADRRLPPSFVLVPGSVAARKNEDSWVTTVSPKVGVNFAPLLGSSNALQVLTLGYAPDIAQYHNERTEDYTAHRLATTIKAHEGDFQFNLENGFNYIDGDSVAPTYPNALLSAYASAAPRERRRQIQDRSKIAFQYDQESFFLRPTASLLYYDLMTLQTNELGYQNYVDRYDVNGGLDFGYKLKPDLAAILGYRYGHQYQQQLSFDLHSATCDYQRVLAGLEGKPCKWLTVSLLGGPDFRNYEADKPGSHIASVKDQNLITYYGEAGITADLTTADALTFKYRGFQWVSSVGRVPYFDSVYDLSYRHKFSPKLLLEVGGRIQTSDYTSGNLASSQRNDGMFSTSLGVTYAFTSFLSANLTYNVDLGRNFQDGVVNPQNREFDRHLVSLGMLVKF